MNHQKRTMTSAQYAQYLSGICGTLAIEGIKVSKATRKNLDRIASGQAGYQQVLRELRAKYTKEQ